MTPSAMTVAMWVALVIVSVVQGQSNNDTKLLLVQMLFRHGARAPIIPYPTDPNPPESWPEGFGRLTQLGKKQHYVLGKFLRSFYSGFITSNPNEIMVNSTDYDRCLRSALSNLASFFAPSERWEIDEDFDWQPIPIHYAPSESDRYLSMGSECPRFFEEQDNRFNSTLFLNVVAKHQHMIDAVKNYSGVDDWQYCCLVQDTIISEKAHGLIIPEWITPYWDELTELAEFAFFWLFDGETQKRLRAGPILQKIIENMDNTLSGIKPHVKVHMFSAHDANLVALLEALDLYYRRPPFCATLLIELHEMPDGDKTVRLLYLNSTRPEDIHTHRPLVLRLEGCSEFCPLESFRASTRHLIPEDWDEECLTPNVMYRNETESLARLFGTHEFVNMTIPPVEMVDETTAVPAGTTTVPAGTSCRPSVASNEVLDCR